MAWGDFVTIRHGDPLLPNYDYEHGVPYSMSPEIHEDYPTDGSMKQFVTFCRIEEDVREKWLRAMLPDHDSANGTELTSTQFLSINPYDLNPTTYPRQTLRRFLPEQHPRFPNAFVKQVTLVKGEGFPYKTDDFWLGFSDFRPENDDTPPGKLLYRVLWSEYPYNLTLGKTVTTSYGRKVPDQQNDDITCNKSDHSELERYCYVHPMPKSKFFQVAGNFLYFIRADGTVLTEGAQGRMVNVSTTAQSIPFGMVGIQVEWNMIPRVPTAVYSLMNCLNQFKNIAFDPTIIPIVPGGSALDIETLGYIAPEIKGPYYTITGKLAYNIVLNLLYNPNPGKAGSGVKNRGQNAIFYPPLRDVLRVVAGPTLNGFVGFDTSADPDLTSLPSDGTPITTARKAGHNIYNVADLLNLWKFD